MGRLRKVRGEGGRILPFRQVRIAQSIREAIEVCGEADTSMADELAGVVTLFLEKRFGDERLPTLSDIREMVHRVLVETGHVRVAATFERLAKSSLNAPSADDANLFATESVGETLLAEDLVEVVRPVDGLPVAFDRQFLARSLSREADVPDRTAAEVAAEVADRLVRSGLRRIGTPQIRALVDAIFIERGDDGWLHRGRQLGVGKADVDAWIQATGSPAADPEENCAQALLSDWALDSVYSPAVRRAHIEGRLHLLGLGHPQRVEEVSFCADGPLIKEVASLEEFLLELVTLLQSLRPLVRQKIVVARFSQAFAAVTRRVSKRAAEAFVDRLLDQLLRVDLYGRPVFPPVVLEIHLSGDQLLGAGANAEFDRVKLLADILLDRLEFRASMGGRLGLHFLLSARPDCAWPESETLARVFRVARRHPGIAFRLLRRDQSLQPGGASDSSDRVTLDVGACAVNVPHALALAGVHSVDEIGGALTASVSLAVSSLFEKYWFLRKSAPETLRGVIARLPGGREVRIESSGQGGQILLWGLPQALRLLKARDLVDPGAEPEMLAKILSCVDYISGEERENVRLGMRIGGLRDRAVQERFFHATDGLAARIADRALAAALEAPEDDHAGLPIGSPILSPANRAVLDGAFLERLGPGLALPARGEDAIASGYWLTRLFESTSLNYFELEERAWVIEIQEDLFQEIA